MKRSNIVSVLFLDSFTALQLYDVFFRKYPKYLKYPISPKHQTSPDIATEGMSNKARRQPAASGHIFGAPVLELRHTLLPAV